MGEEGDGRFAVGRFGRYAASGALHTPARDQQAIRFHYDLSNAFYKMWLDEQMVYSCAYFTGPNESLESAQKRKLDLVCQKLQLKPGERLLDVGCGWGSLLIHAAAEYGVEATGVSISQAQTEEAQARIAAAGLSDRCRIVVSHYEHFAVEQPFDKAVSIGMFEHVGPQRLPGYFERVHGWLRPAGLFLLQGASTYVQLANRRRNWLEWLREQLGRGREAFYQNYIFPDSHLVDLPTIIAAGERPNLFELRHVECLRDHYALTLRHWLQRLETNEAAATAEVGQVAYRAWRLLTAYAGYFMDKGLLTEYQTLFARKS